MTKRHASQASRKGTQQGRRIRRHGRNVRLWCHRTSFMLQYYHDCNIVDITFPYISDTLRCNHKPNIED